MFDFEGLNGAVSAVFGEPVIVRHGSDPDWPATGIFDQRHYALDDGVGGGSTLVTTVSLRLDDLAGLDADDVIVARGVAYAVSDLKPDGQGMVVATLRLA